MLIEVRVTDGRKAFDKPTGGTEIPPKTWKKLKQTKWIERLIEVGDLEVKQKASSQPAKKPETGSAEKPNNETKG